MTPQPESGNATPSLRGYSAPTLTVYGSLESLTHTEAQGPNFDGGSGANIYAS